MNLYLAEISYEKNHYEGKTERNLKMLRLVRADSAEEAREKADDYIRSKTSEYCMYYYANDIEISECIE